MTRRGGAKVHSTREAGEPFSWTLGDGSVIEGLELAVGGGGGLPPMLVGGARRVIVPMARGYGSQTGGPSRAKEAQQDRLWATNVRDLGPVPPEYEWQDAFSGERVNSYLRFKSMYQNPNAYDQPDLVFDILLRSSSSSSSPAQQAEEPEEGPP